MWQRVRRRVEVGSRQPADSSLRQHKLSVGRAGFGSGLGPGRARARAGSGSHARLAHGSEGIATGSGARVSGHFGTGPGRRVSGHFGARRRGRASGQFVVAR